MLTVAMLAGLTACSREQRDWRSAQAADSLESYDRFLESHPDSTLATQARMRVAQLTEARDWQRASSADTADSYRQFLNQHPNGKWSQEARIRLENFSLEGQSFEQPVELTARTTPSASTAPMQSDSSEFAAAPMAERPVRDDPVPPVAPPPRSSHDEKAEHERTTAYESGFRIQLGAFGSEGRAHEEWQRLESRFSAELSALEPHVIPARTAAGELYRLQATVENEGRARAICASLLEQSQGCVVVLPHH
jgi:cell division septation protein DedD